MTRERLETLVGIPDMPDELAAWLCAGYARWLAGESLDRALDLRARPGRRRPATLARIASRNALLREAWQRLAAETPWKRSLALAELIGRLEPVYRGYRAGRQPASEVNRLLCQARDAWRLPATAARLHKVCSQSIEDAFSKIWKSRATA